MNFTHDEIDFFLLMKIYWRNLKKIKEKETFSRTIRSGSRPPRTGRDREAKPRIAVLNPIPLDSIIIIILHSKLLLAASKFFSLQKKKASTFWEAVGLL